MEKNTEAFEAGKHFAETGEFPKLPDQKEFDSLCLKPKIDKSLFNIYHTLSDYLSQLFDREHNYETITKAFVAGLNACWQAMLNHDLGCITGFQAGWILNRFFTEQKNLACWRLLDYDKMLYPQYEYMFEKTINKDTWKFLQEKAKYMLSDEDFHVHEEIKEHWRSIAEGKVPFGFIVKD